MLHGDEVVQQDDPVFLAADTALHHHLIVQLQYLSCEFPVDALLGLFVGDGRASADHSVIFDHILVHYFLNALKFLGAAVDGGVSGVDQLEVLEVVELAADDSSHHVL